MSFDFNPIVPAHNPRNTAKFILKALRDDIWQSSDKVKAQQQSLSIMQTKSQINALFCALRAAKLPLWALDTTHEELAELLKHAEEMR